MLPEEFLKNCTLKKTKEPVKSFVGMFRKMLLPSFPPLSDQLISIKLAFFIHENSSKL